MARLRARLGQSEGKFVDLAPDPVGIALAGDELGQHARIELVLGDQHARGEGGGVVAGQDRDFDLAEHRPVVELGGDEVDRAAG